MANVVEVSVDNGQIKVHRVVSALDGGRIGIASQAIGIARSALSTATEYARDRRQFGQAIGEFQAIQFALADMATRTEAARLLTYRAAILSDQGRATPEAISMSKLFASEALAFVSDSAVQIQGGSGYIAGNPVNRFYRDARVTRIYEGTSEIQRLIIGRSMLRR